MLKDICRNSKKFKFFILILSILIAVCVGSVCLSSCSSNNTPSNSQNQEKQSFTDTSGREVTFNKDIKKYVVTGNIGQITLYALDPDRLSALAVAWSDSTKKYINEKYLNLDILGEIYGGKQDFSKEELLKINPDLIIDIGQAKNSIKEDMDNLQNQTSIPVIHFDGDIQNFPYIYRSLGKILDREEKAEKIASFCETTYNNAKSFAQTKTGNMPSLLYCLEKEGCNVMCKNSYHAGIIDMLSNNVAVVDSPTSKGTGNEVDFEQILKWDPDVLIFAPNSCYSKVKDDPKWNQLKAVQNNKYFEVPGQPYNWMGYPPAMHQSLGFLWLEKLLYGNEANYDLKSKVEEAYKLFFDYSLTDDEYSTLIKNSISK